jgi:predicted DNA-binding antitoxin AbrB/MazE fold protein
MTTTVPAVYEGGVFRPTRKLMLSEGTHVDVVIPEAAVPRDAKAVAAKLASIAAKAARHGKSDSASRDHDRILYGGEEPV